MLLNGYPTTCLVGRRTHPPAPSTINVWIQMFGYKQPMCVCVCVCVCVIHIISIHIFIKTRMKRAPQYIGIWWFSQSSRMPSPRIHTGTELSSLQRQSKILTSCSQWPLSKSQLISPYRAVRESGQWQVDQTTRVDTSVLQTD